MRIFITSFLLLFILTGLHSSPIDAASSVVRYAFIISANDGGKDKPHLRYAVKDAESFSEVLKELGNLAKENTFFLVEPDSETLFKSMNRLNTMIRNRKNSSAKVETIFYYSGHSDDKHFLIKNDKIPYKRFHNEIKKIESDVKIAILDSCSSGSFNQLKGVKVKPPFLNNSAYDMKGYAFMTSSSPVEPSQESGYLKGSIFTHYLISGLRGAADLSEDKIITLNEAYQYAYRETLIHSQQTEHGPQHPGYNIQMSGKGDVIMTDIKQSTSLLIIEKGISGRLFINNSKGNLVVEINKTAGKQIAIGLEPDNYQVILKNGKQSMKAACRLTGSSNCILKAEEFSRTSKIPTTRRGVTLDPFDRSSHRFALEVSGGLSLFSGDEFHKNLTGIAAASHYDSMTITNGSSLYFENKHDSPDKIAKISNGRPVGIRGRYYVSDTISLSLGFEYMNESKEADTNTIIEVKNTGLYVDADGWYMDGDIPLKYSVSNYIFTVGIHAGKQIARNLEIEGGLLVGPFFTETQSLFTLRNATGRNYGKSVELDDKRSGTGLSLELSSQLNYYIGNRFALFVTVSYCFRKIDDMADKSEIRINGDKIKDAGFKNVSGDYSLDMSGITMKFGMKFRF